MHIPHIDYLSYLKDRILEIDASCLLKNYPNGEIPSLLRKFIQNSSGRNWGTIFTSRYILLILKFFCVAFFQVFLTQKEKKDNIFECALKVLNSTGK